MDSYSNVNTTRGRDLRNLLGEQGFIVANTIIEGWRREHAAATAGPSTPHPTFKLTPRHKATMEGCLSNLCPSTFNEEISSMLQEYSMEIVNAGSKKTHG